MKTKGRRITIVAGMSAVSITALFCYTYHKDLYLEGVLWGLERARDREEAFARVDSLNDHLKTDLEVVGKLGGKLGQRRPWATFWIIARIMDFPYGLVAANGFHFENMLPLIRGLTLDPSKRELFRYMRHATWFLGSGGGSVRGTVTDLLRIKEDDTPDFLKDWNDRTVEAFCRFYGSELIGDYEMVGCGGAPEPLEVPLDYRCPFGKPA